MTVAPDPRQDRLEAVLSRLQGVRQSGGKHMARCPSHEDTDPSLSVSIGQRGILLYCWAGCPVEAVREALGLSWAELFFEGRRLDAKAPPVDKRSMAIEASMCAARLQDSPEVLERVRAARGWARGALFQLGVGWDGERFTIPVYKDDKPHDCLRYDPFADKWKMLAGPGASRQPWPAPETVTTDLRSRWLFVVEGEGTAISLYSVGLPAVALPGSAGKPSGDVRRPARFQGVGWHPKWARRFYNHRSIVLLPDGDEQGRTLMTAVEHDLRSEGIQSVHTVDLGGPDGSDAGDLLRRAGDLELRRQGKAMLRMLVSTSLRQPRELPVAREIAWAWASYQAPSEKPFEAFSWA